MGEVPKQLKPFLFKKGEVANPAGRPKGKTMKEFAREFLLAMTDEDKINFMNSLEPDVVWKMAEGTPPQDVNIHGEIRMPIYLPSTLIEKRELPQSTGTNSE